MNNNQKIRVNITVDKALLDKAKTKLNLFGGKLSTLFNAYLSDFVHTIDKDFSSQNKEIEARIRILEEKIGKIEKGH